VNPELVCSGLAWISLRYADHQSLNDLEAETRAGNRSEDHPLKVLTGLSIKSGGHRTRVLTFFLPSVQFCSPRKLQVIEFSTRHVTCHLNRQRPKAPQVSSPDALCFTHSKSEVAVDQRRSPRFPVQCTVAYSGTKIAGIGIMSNLSTDGCRVGSYASVEAGTYLEMRVFMLAPDFPMKVDLAAVRWIGPREFGLEFLRMQPEEHERLHRFVATLEAG